MDKEALRVVETVAVVLAALAVAASAAEDQEGSKKDKTLNRKSC